MPLTFLLPLVIFGIAGIVLAVHLTGNSRPLTFAGEDAACRAWNREYPFQPAQSAHLSDDRRAALILADAGGTAGQGTPGVVWAMGTDSTARRLTPNCQLRDRADGLDIVFHDMTAPRLRVALKDPASRDLWHALAAPPGQETIT